MSTTMVGDETEQKLTSDGTDGGHKEVKKAGLIDAFFHPIKTKQQTKLRLEKDIPLNLNSESCQASLKEKASNLSGKSTSDPALSQQGPVKTKQPKPKWSVTCAVRNPSKYLNSSGSDFEDDSKGAFDAKTKHKQAQKSGKKKAKCGAKASCSEQPGSQECERDVSKSEADKDKESKAVHEQKSDTSKLDQHREQQIEKIKLDTESKSLGKGENCKQTRTSAFNVLMKSQRAQKLEDQRTDTSSEDIPNTAVICPDNVLENSGSCEIIDNKETLLPKPNVVSESKLVTITADSSSDKNVTSGITEPNAFDFLMKKGRQQKSPNSVDSQPESEVDSEVLENPDGSLKKKSKKKSLEFKLSICASKKKGVEFSLESDCASNDMINCEEQMKKSRKKTRKHKKAESESVEGASDGSFVSEKCEEVVEVSKSKTRRKKSKGKSTEDQADNSVIEVTPTEPGNKSDKEKSKSRKKVSGTKKTTAVTNKGGGDIEEIDPPCVKAAQIKRKKAKQQRNYDKNSEEGKNEKLRELRKRKTSDAASASPQSISTECQETSVCDLNKGADIDQTKRKRGEKKQTGTPSETELPPSTDNKKTTEDKNDKEDNVKEMETTDLQHKKSSDYSEPKVKPLASIFLKKKPIPTKPDTTEAPPITTAHTAPSTTTIPSTNNCDTSDAVCSQHKEKSAADKVAANKAFKALFTGASAQKSLPTSNAAEALPAPWPLISHVHQKEENTALSVNFWCLPWPAGKSYNSDDFLQSLLLNCTCADVAANIPSSPETTVMFCGRRHFEHCLHDSKKVGKDTAQHNFPEAVIKKLLSELALFYPGVPLRKLYKRYASKLEKHKTNSAAVESKQTAAEKSTPADDTKGSLKPSENNEDKQDAVGKMKGRGKRRLSSDGGVSQEKKLARKSEDFPSSLSTKGQDLMSGKKACKKRGREEDIDQGQEKPTKGRRLSTRLQKKKDTLESESIESDLEQSEDNSNRKKKQRTSENQRDAKETSKSSVEPGKLTDAAVTSNDKKNSVEGFVSDTLWTDLYRPLHSTEVIANASAVSKLRSWLEEWKIKREKTLRKELQQQKKLLAKQKSKSTASSSQGSSHTLEWWDDDSDSDFQISDDNASDDSDTEGGGLSTAMFISGPTGVGKTAMVYACAEELGYKVFEVNSSSKRSGKHILSQLEEATQSHLVINNKAPPPPPQSSFAGLFNKPVDNSSPASGPLGAFLKSNADTSEARGKKGGKGRKQKNASNKKKDEPKGKGKSILKQPSQPVNDDSVSCSSLSSKAASLILFEEVDVIFEEDKSFWMAVNSFMQNAKCPIVLISTESQVSCEGRYDQINLKSPSVNLLAAHLQLVALTNNMFVSPDELKSLVAQNNCDIRKSLLNLQFWSSSGGGVKIPYKRPASLKDKESVIEKHSKPPHEPVGYDSNMEKVTTGTAPSQDVLQIEPPVTSGILNDDGEESMFLSLNDWQMIKNRGSRRSSRSSQRGSLRQADGDNNSDSDFCEPKKKTLLCSDGTTDSIFEITDTNDSQPCSSTDKKADESLQLPVMDSLLVESSNGLLNCVADHSTGSLSVLLKKKSGDIAEDYDKLHLTHFSQAMDLNLIHTNLSTLIPLFAESPTSPPQTKPVPLLLQESNTVLPIAEHLDFKSTNIFSDKSLFDDGTEETGNKADNDIAMETDHTEVKDAEDTKAKAVQSSQDSTDTGFSESQSKEETSEEGQGHEEDTEDSVKKEQKRIHRKPSQEERCCSKALEIFAQFAENMSFTDAFCPSLSVSSTQSTSAEFGWWGASLKPGLTDEHVTVQECSDWLACDTRASLRGALEVANLESCRLRIHSLAEDLKEIEKSTSDENSSTAEGNELYNFKILIEDLPPRDSSNVVRLNELTQMQKSSTTSRKKLHNFVCPCIPAVYHCDHRCVASDYMPTLRLLCHSERLREAANIKRRFLHYLDFNSFPLSRSTMEALADSYLAK